MQIEYNETSKIRIEDIHLDLGNTRKKEPSDEYISDLAYSIKLAGMIHPITYIVHEGKIQLVSGWCRLKASKKNGAVEIDAREALTDIDGAKVIQFIENHDRQNIDPLEERDVFNEWKEKGKSPDDIAALLGVSVTYVYSRLNLNRLIAEVELCFSQGHLNITAALEFCKLTPTRQTELLQLIRTGDDWHDIKLIRAHIENISTDLAIAPFDTKDPNAFGGACVDCLKRSGCMKLLFPDITKDDICYDKDCFKAKIDHHYIGVMDEIRKRGDVVYTVSDKHHSHETAINAGFNLSLHVLEGVMPDDPAYTETSTHIYGLLIDSYNLANRGMIIKILETHPEEAKKEVATNNNVKTAPPDNTEDKQVRSAPLTKKDKAALAVANDLTSMITNCIVNMDNIDLPSSLLQWIGWEQFQKVDFNSAITFIKHFNFRYFAKPKDIKPEEIEGIYFRNVKDMLPMELVKIVKTLLVFNLTTGWQYGCGDSREEVLKLLAENFDIDIQEICEKHKYE